MNFASAANKPVNGSGVRKDSLNDLSFHYLKDATRDLIQPKSTFLVDGKPAISFSEAEVSAMSEPYHLTLVSKFMGNNPPKISEITPEFRKISLKQGFNLRMLDYRHLMITLFLE